MRRVTDHDPILSLDVGIDGSEAVVRLSGELDPHSAESLAETLGRLATTAGIDRVVLHMAGVDFVDSSGLRVLLSADGELTDAGKHLVVRSPSPAVQRLLEITDLLDRLEIE